MDRKDLHGAEDLRTGGASLNPFHGMQHAAHSGAIGCARHKVGANVRLCPSERRADALPAALNPIGCAQVARMPGHWPSRSMHRSTGLCKPLQLAGRVRPKSRPRRPCRTRTRTQPVFCPERFGSGIFAGWWCALRAMITLAARPGPHQSRFPGLRSPNSLVRNSRFTQMSKSTVNYGSCHAGTSRSGATSRAIAFEVQDGRICASALRFRNEKRTEWPSSPISRCVFGHSDAQRDFSGSNAIALEQPGVHLELGVLAKYAALGSLARFGEGTWLHPTCRKGLLAL